VEGHHHEQHDCEWVAGHKIQATATGPGSYAAGTIRYGYLINWGAKGIVAIYTITNATPTAGATKKSVVDRIAQGIVIKP
jgi:hypothetical protein